MNQPKIVKYFLNPLLKSNKRLKYSYGAKYKCKKYGKNVSHTNIDRTYPNI